MKRRSRSQRLVAEINITPFTDVILVILIIFMGATPLLVESSLAINLPKSSTLQQPPGANKLADGTIASGDAVLENTQYSLRFDLGVLKFKLADLAKRSPDLSIVIHGDKDVKYDFVIKVIDLASQAGIKHIVLATEFVPGKK